MKTKSFPFTQEGFDQAKAYKPAKVNTFRLVIQFIMLLILLTGNSSIVAFQPNLIYHLNNGISNIIP